MRRTKVILLGSLAAAKRDFERASRSHKGMDAENIHVTSRYLDAGTRNPRQSDLEVGLFAKVLLE